MYGVGPQRERCGSGWTAVRSVNAAAQGKGPQRERHGSKSGVGAMPAGSFFRP